MCEQIPEELKFQTPTHKRAKILCPSTPGHINPNPNPKDRDCHPLTKNQLRQQVQSLQDASEKSLHNQQSQWKGVFVQDKQKKFSNLLCIISKSWVTINWKQLSIWTIMKTQLTYRLGPGAVVASGPGAHHRSECFADYHGPWHLPLAP